MFYQDANGPEVFNRCVNTWIHPSRAQKNSHGEYKHKISAKSGQKCDTGETPSSSIPICKKFYEKIKKLKQ